MIKALCDHYNAQNTGQGPMENSDNYVGVSIRSLESMVKALPNQQSTKTSANGTRRPRLG